MTSQVWTSMGKRERSMSHGASMGICRGVPVILEDLAHVKPTVLFAVPTLYFHTHSDNTITVAAVVH